MFDTVKQHTEYENCLHDKFGLKCVVSLIFLFEISGYIKKLKDSYPNWILIKFDYTLLIYKNIYLIMIDHPEI